MKINQLIALCRSTSKRTLKRRDAGWDTGIVEYASIPKVDMRALIAKHKSIKRQLAACKKVLRLAKYVGNLGKYEMDILGKAGVDFRNTSL